MDYREEYEADMREQEQDGWDDDLYYNPNDDEPKINNLDEGFASWEDVNGQFFVRY